MRESGSTSGAETEKEGRNKIHGKGQCPLAQVETLPTAKFVHVRKAQQMMQPLHQLIVFLE
jgi:hypothetical protein